MQAIQDKPARALIRFWRVLFWLTLIHLVIVGFMAVSAFVQMESGELFRTFHPKALGLINAASLWLFWHTRGSKGGSKGSGTEKTLCLRFAGWILAADLGRRIREVLSLERGRPPGRRLCSDPVLAARLAAAQCRA